MPSHDRASSNAFSRGTFTSGGAGATLELALKCMWRQPPFVHTLIGSFTVFSPPNNTLVYSTLNRVSMGYPALPSMLYWLERRRNNLDRTPTPVRSSSICYLDKTPSHAPSRRSGCPQCTDLRFADNLAVCSLADLDLHVDLNFRYSILRHTQLTGLESPPCVISCERPPALAHLFTFDLACARCCTLLRAVNRGAVLGSSQDLNIL